MRRASLPALVVATLLGAAVRAQEPAPPIRLDDGRLRELVARLVPAVERAAGRTFTSPPKAIVADVGDVARALVDDLAPPLRAFYRDQPRSRVDKAIRLRAEVLAGSMLGKYGLYSGELYVLAHRLGPMLDLFGVDRAVGDDVLQLVIAHELAHALQDQHVDLKALAARTLDQDRIHAMVMLIEGHAQVVGEAALRELGGQQAIEPLRRIFRGETKEPFHQRHDMQQRPSRDGNLVDYERGRQLVEQVVARDGHEEVWRLFAAPMPRSVQWLLPTEAALPAAAEGADECEALVAALPDAAAIVRGAWTWGRGAVGAALLDSENAPRREQLRPLLRAVRGGAMLEGTGATPVVRLAVMVVGFAAAADAEAFAALAVDAAEHDLKVLRHHFPSVEPTVVEDAPAVDGTDGPGRRLLQVPGKAMSVSRASLHWYRRGRHVVQVTAISALPDDATVVRLVSDLLARLPKD